MTILQEIHNFISRVEINNQKKLLKKASIDLNELHQATAKLLRLYSEGYRYEPQENDCEAVHLCLCSLRGDAIGRILRDMQLSCFKGTLYQYNLNRLVDAIAITSSNALAYDQRDRYMAHQDAKYMREIREYIKPIHELTTALIGDKN